MTETEDYDKSSTPTTHHTTHEKGGSDEVTGVLLQDGTKPLNGNWDAGDGKKIITDTIRARDTDGLSLQDDDGNGLFIHDGGIITVAKQSSFAARLTSDQTVTPGAAVKAIMSTEIFDIQNEFDNATNYRFTASKAGLYAFRYNLLFTPSVSSASLEAYFLKNGSEKNGYVIGTISPGNKISKTIVALIQLSVSDYVEVWGEMISGNSLVATALQGYNTFSGFKLA